MSGHTKGPWTLEEHESVEVIGENRRVAEVWLNEHTKANAALISAAPDLLEALEKISLMRGIADGDIWDLVDAMEKEAQAALKKAKP